MDRDYYYQYKEQLEERESRLENKLDDLKEEYADTDPEDEEMIHKLELEISYAESDLEEVQDELGRLLGSYDEYYEDGRMSYEEEQWEDHNMWDED